MPESLLRDRPSATARARAPRHRRTSTRPAPARRRRRRRPFVVFVGFLALFFVALAAWSWSTPLFGSPDEPVHTIKAAAVVRGEFVGTPVAGPQSAEVVVTVPRLFAEAGTLPGCFAFKASIPASCARAPAGGTGPMAVAIYNGRYPPLYYAVVGLPSLADVSASGIYLMRLLSALLGAVFLALAATSIVVWSRSKVLLAGLALAATPTVFFFGGVVNPSSLELTSAVCLWCSALVLVLERSEEAPGLLVATVALSASVMVLSRGLSPLWVAMIGCSVVALAPREAATLMRNRRARVAAACVVACAGLAVAWILAEHSLDVQAVAPHPAAGTSSLGILRAVFGRTPQFLTEMIGRFGWLESPSPLYTYLAWYVGLGVLAGGALVLSRTRRLVVLVGVTAASVVVPALISASQARHSGYVWQGKDSLPFALGVPLVAAAILGCSGAVRTQTRRLVGVVAVGTAIGEVLSFCQALRRNAVGVAGPLDYFHGPWHPPLGALAPTLVVLAVWALICIAIWRCAAGAPAFGVVSYGTPTRPGGRDGHDSLRSAAAVPRENPPGP